MIALAGEDRLLSVSNSEGDTFKQVLNNFYPFRMKPFFKFFNFKAWHTNDSKQWYYITSGNYSLYSPKTECSSSDFMKIVVSRPQKGREVVTERCSILSVNNLFVK